MAQVLDPHISAVVRLAVDGVAKLVLVSVVVEADNHLHQLYEALCINIPSLHLLYWATIFLTVVEQMVAVFHPPALLPCLQNL